MYLKGKEEAIKWADSLGDNDVVFADVWGVSDVMEEADNLYNDDCIPRPLTAREVDIILLSFEKHYNIETGINFEILQKRIIDCANGRDIL